MDIVTNIIKLENPNFEYFCFSHWNHLCLTLIFQKKLFYLLQWKPFKNDEKCVLFKLKALFVLKIFKFLSYHAENDTGRLVPDLFLSFKQVLHELKAIGQQHIINIYWQPSAWYWKQMYQTLDDQSRDTLNFDFLEKGLGIVSSPHFGYDLARKMYLMLCSNNWQIPMNDCRYFLRYCVVCVLELFLSQAVTSYILKLTLTF